MNEELFNNWADSYDESIKKSELDKTYPFYGYGKIQEIIYSEVKKQDSANILEMGIGTGMMTKRLYDEGYQVLGVDFSSNMLEKARTIMPKNIYIQSDFLTVLPRLKGEMFDVIIFSYSIHHLDYLDQITLVEALSKNLKDDGKIIIGDVMAKTKEDMKKLSIQNSRIWDDEEFYPIEEVYDEETLKSLYTLNYNQLTFCSGVMILNKL